MIMNGLSCCKNNNPNLQERHRHAIPPQTVQTVDQVVPPMNIAVYRVAPWHTMMAPPANHILVSQLGVFVLYELGE